MIDKRPSDQNAIEKNGAYAHAKTLAIYAFLILLAWPKFPFFHILTHLYKSFFYNNKILLGNLYLYCKKISIMRVMVKTEYRIKCLLQTIFLINAIL